MGNIQSVDASKAYKKLKKGFAVIVNNIKFERHLDRTGSEKDVVDLTILFENNLNCTVIKILDKSKEEIFEDIHKINFMEVDEYDFLVVVVMTHGSEGGILLAKESTYNVSDIVNLFQIKSHFQGKPKIFIFQACRGRDVCFDDANYINSKQIEIHEEEFQPYKSAIKVDEHTLLAFSTIENKASNRCEYTGAIYIQVIITTLNCISVNQEITLNQILLDVTDNVCHKTSAIKKQTQNRHQTAVFQSFMNYNIVIIGKEFKTTWATGIQETQTLKTDSYLMMPEESSDTTWKEDKNVRFADVSRYETRIKKCFFFFDEDCEEDVIRYENRFKANCAERCNRNPCNDNCGHVKFIKNKLKRQNFIDIFELGLSCLDSDEGVFVVFLAQLKKRKNKVSNESDLIFKFQDSEIKFAEIIGNMNRYNNRPKILLIFHPYEELQTDFIDTYSVDNIEVEEIGFENADTLMFLSTGNDAAEIFFGNLYENEHILNIIKTTMTCKRSTFEFLPFYCSTLRKQIYLQSVPLNEKETKSEAGNSYIGILKSSKTFEDFQLNVTQVVSDMKNKSKSNQTSNEIQKMNKDFDETFRYVSSYLNNSGQNSELYKLQCDNITKKFEHLRLIIKENYCTNTTNTLLDIYKSELQFKDLGTHYHKNIKDELAVMKSLKIRELTEKLLFFEAKEKYIEVLENEIDKINEAVIQKNGGLRTLELENYLNESEKKYRKGMFACNLMESLPENNEIDSIHDKIIKCIIEDFKIKCKNLNFEVEENKLENLLEAELMCIKENIVLQKYHKLNKQTRQYVFGIDFGTLNSCACLYKNIYDVKNANEISFFTPSAILMEENHLIVGLEALEKSKNATKGNLILGLKKILSASNNNTDLNDNENGNIIKRRQDGEIVFQYIGKPIEYTLPELHAAIVKKLKHYATDTLKLPINFAVATVPAHFKFSQIQTVLRACELAGLRILRITDESNAAIYSCFPKVHIKEEKNILLFYFSESVCYLAICKVNNNTIDCIATYISQEIKSQLFDSEIYPYIQSIAGNGITRQVSLRDCANARLELSVKNSASVSFSINDRKFGVIIKRECFEKLNKKYFDEIPLAITNCLDRAKLSKSQIYKAILAGNCANMPKIEQIFKNYFREDIICESPITTDFIVAYGAAVQAAIITGQYK